MRDSTAMLMRCFLPRRSLFRLVARWQQCPHGSFCHRGVSSLQILTESVTQPHQHTISVKSLNQPLKKFFSDSSLWTSTNMRIHPPNKYTTDSMEPYFAPFCYLLTQLPLKVLMKYLWHVWVKYHRETVQQLPFPSWIYTSVHTECCVRVLSDPLDSTPPIPQSTLLPKDRANTKPHKSTLFTVVLMTHLGTISS